ncbi:MAG: TatD family hydrolase [Gammaproteobacteria bacterium]|nr:TatD family hydrolase [Gammaproteobacteria bacterium]MBT6457387.1 TatD family hydrolase [Gammaproteobacteria bacterium]MBT6702154.1 TatD family hydrolase [Gammaproteobacteria bacterium]
MLIDSHCHLDDDRFDADRDAVIQRAFDQGIKQFIIPATIATRWAKIKHLSQSYKGVYASYGLHPMFMQDHQPGDVAALDAWLDVEDAVAVGECGLDFYQGNSDEKQQIELLRGQLQVALNHHKPVIIHARKALDLILREIRQSGINSGVIHSFSGSLQQAEQLVDLGFKLGIAATVSFERAKKLREITSKIDSSALLIESDAPDQSGEQHRGIRNEPAFIVDHLNVMAELRSIPVAVLSNELSKNSRELFGLSQC